MLKSISVVLSTLASPCSHACGTVGNYRNLVNASFRSHNLQYNHLRNFSIAPGPVLQSASDHHHDLDDPDLAEPKGHPFQSLFPWKSKPEFVKHLITQIVHADDGLVVINKPFGVGVINAKAKSKGREPHHSHLRGVALTDYSLEIALPYLRSALNKPDLVLVKSTEKMTSGIAVFADNLKYAGKFQSKFKSSKLMSNVKPFYNYLVITAASPFTNEKVFHEKVGLQLKSPPLSDIMQPSIVRNFSNNALKRQDVKPVHVKTTVLKYGAHKTALLNISTSSVKWSFLRIYCADLMIPILGDHLYSCRVQTVMGVPTKIDISHAPPGCSDQKLSPHVLQALQVRESIQVPPHMHLLSYTLNNFKGKGQHLELEAPTPSHFEWTKNQLNLL